MAYHCLHTNTTTGYTEALAFVSDSLETIGWTLHDDISATEKVFTSTGERGIFLNAYIRLYVSTYIRLEGYMWWNNSTHTGTGKAYSHTSYNYLKVIDGESLVVYGDKDCIVLWAASDVVNSVSKGFGFIQPYIEGYTTASGISSGSDIIVSLDDASKFYKDSDVMIVGTETEGRDRVNISEVISDTQIKLTSTPRAYAAGAKIGYFPCPFFVTSYQSGFSDASFQYVCGYSSVGTTIPASYTYCQYKSSGRLFNTPSYIDPDEYVDRYVLQTSGYVEGYTPYSSVGYNTVYKRSPVSSSKANYAQDLFCSNYGEVWYGTPTSATSSGIIDIGHSWTNDQFKDKIIIITSGPGLGETRKVLSNTSDTLNTGDLWSTTPTIESTYEVYDIVYRNVSNFICVNEIIE